MVTLSSVHVVSLASVEEKELTKMDMEVRNSYMPHCRMEEKLTRLSSGEYIHMNILVIVDLCYMRSIIRRNSSNRVYRLRGNGKDKLRANEYSRDDKT